MMEKYLIENFLEKFNVAVTAEQEFTVTEMSRYYYHFLDFLNTFGFDAWIGVKHFSRVSSTTTVQL